MGRSNPFDEIEDLLDRMSREFGGQLLPDVGAGVAVDVADRGEEFVVTADLPGFDTDDVDVTVTDSRLRIEADRERSETDEGATYLRRERRRESASRTVRLPEPVDEDAVSATFEAGVLTVTLPKRDADGGRSIEIQ